MLAVVTITGILAMIGVTLSRRYILSSKGTEAAGVIQAIRAAEESYLAENHVYLDVSTPNNWYPTLVPGLTRRSWKVPAGGHPDVANWNQLAPAVNRSVQFGYLANAGVAGTARPVLSTKVSPTWAKVPTDSWYVIQARGDTDGDGVFSQYAATEVTGELYVENEGH
jgi:hypothetical protein